MITIDGKEYPHSALIGLCSTTGPESGKSFAAKKIVEMSGHSGKVLSLATPLKTVTAHLIRAVWGLNPDTLDKKDKLTQQITVRDLYIELGTNGFRKQVDEDLWIYLLKKKLQQELELAGGKPVVFIVDDLRFLNEFDFVVESGGQVFNVKNIDHFGRSFKDAGDLPPGDFFCSSRTLLNNTKSNLLELEIKRYVLPLINKMMGGN